MKDLQKDLFLAADKAAKGAGGERMAAIKKLVDNALNGDVPYEVAISEIERLEVCMPSLKEQETAHPIIHEDALKEYSFQRDHYGLRG